MNCLRVFDHFVGLALKGLRHCQTSIIYYGNASVQAYVVWTMTIHKIYERS